MEEEVVYIRSSRRLASDARDAYEILNIDGTNEGWLVFKIPYVADEVSPKKHIPKKSRVIHVSEDEDEG